MSLNTRLVEGHDAWRLLDDPGFRQEWQAIAAFDPKYTWFQEPHFCMAWYRAYKDSVQPVLAVGYQGSTLSALMPLATTAGLPIAHAGTHQCEYQGWVAGSVDDGSFVLDSINLLTASGRIQRWTWQHLAPGAPIGWLADVSSAGIGGITRKTTLAPLLDVSQQDFIKDRVKGRLKTKMNRLRKRGMMYERLRDPERIDTAMRRLAAWYDLRQGAAHASIPFTDDPCKLDFYTRLASDPDQVWLSVLNLDDAPIAAHIGPMSNGELSINLPSHSLRENRDSPGLILLVEMADDLRRSGGQTLDLTPGGETHKSRFSTHQRSLEGFTLFRSRAHAAMVQSQSRLKHAFADALRRFRMDPSAVRNRLAGRAGSQPQTQHNLSIIEHERDPKLAEPTPTSVTPLDTAAVETMLTQQAKALPADQMTAFLTATAAKWSEGWRPVLIGGTREDTDKPARDLVWLQPDGAAARKVPWPANALDPDRSESTCVAWTFQTSQRDGNTFAPAELEALVLTCVPGASRLLLLCERA